MHNISVLVMQIVACSILSPDILSPTFRNTASLCSSPNLRDQASHPFKTTLKLYRVFTKWTIIIYFFVGPFSLLFLRLFKVI